jgi:hypothetical protein
LAHARYYRYVAAQPSLVAECRPDAPDRHQRGLKMMIGEPTAGTASRPLCPKERTPPQ